MDEKTSKLQQEFDTYYKMIGEVEDYAILLLDKDGIIQTWNKGAEKIKGYRAAEVIGKHFGLFYLPVDKEKGLPQHLLQTAALEGKAEYEGWRLRKNGEAFWGSVVITAVHGQDNEVIGFSKVTRDLTSKKQLEDQLKEYAAKLEASNQELQRFAYVAAHDMKEPLRKIQFYNSTLKDHLGATIAAKDHIYLDRSIAAAIRMQQLIDDLLAYAGLAMAEISFGEVDLNEVLKQIHQSHIDSFEQMGAVLTAARLPVIRAVRSQMVQLLDNLIGNALKYRHPSRSPEISITYAAKEKNFVAHGAAGQHFFHCVYHIRQWHWF